MKTDIHAEISGNKTKTWFIMTLFVIIFTGFFYMIGLFYGDGSSGFYIIIGLTISLLSTVGSYYYSDKLVLATTKARPATKEEFFDFYTVTENLVIAAGMPMPKLYVIDDPAPNAFATGRNPEHAVVAATTGLLNMLDRTEIEGVIAHELSHIKNYDMLVSTITAVLVGSIALIADFIMRGIWWGGGNRDNESKNPFGVIILILVLIITPIISTLIQLAVSRRREYLADASGALLTRYPEGLARALEKISSYPGSVRSATTSTAHLFIANPFKKGSSWIQGLFSTHPPAEERIKILRGM